MPAAAAFAPAARTGLVALLICGCTTQTLPPPVEPAQPETPAQAAQEALRARYPADLQACRAQASQAGVLREALDGMVEGAVVAAALVWGLGRSHTAVQDWAAGGALLGAGQAGTEALQRQQRLLAACMAARGHGSGPQPYAYGPVVPAAPAAPFVPPRPTGTDTFNAERLARDQACSAQPLASLAAKGPGFETYAVPCDNGDALAVRCEFGNCRVLR